MKHIIFHLFIVFLWQSVSFFSSFILFYFVDKIEKRICACCLNEIRAIKQEERSRKEKERTLLFAFHRLTMFKYLFNKLHPFGGFEISFTNCMNEESILCGLNLICDFILFYFYRLRISSLLSSARTHTSTHSSTILKIWSIQVIVCWRFLWAHYFMDHY